MGKTYRHSEESISKKEKNKNQIVIASYCLDCKEIYDTCFEDHLCPNCGSWLMETDGPEITN
jgi:rRNA maturation endonuclease Nob1